MVSSQEPDTKEAVWLGRLLYDWEGRYTETKVSAYIKLSASARLITPFFIIHLSPAQNTLIRDIWRHPICVT